MILLWCVGLVLAIMGMLGMMSDPWGERPAWAILGVAGGIMMLVSVWW